MGESWALGTVLRAQGMGTEDTYAVEVCESLIFWTRTMLEVGHNSEGGGEAWWIQGDPGSVSLS